MKTEVSNGDQYLAEALHRQGSWRSPAPTTPGGLALDADGRVARCTQSELSAVQEAWGRARADAGGDFPLAVARLALCPMSANAWAMALLAIGRDAGLEDTQSAIGMAFPSAEAFRINRAIHVALLQIDASTDGAVTPRLRDSPPIGK